MPRYCERCILPDTRPGVKLDAQGVCGGCRNAEEKRRIDWAERAKAFRAVAEHAKGNARTWDCLVPVSGGKDSFWQVVTCLEHGLNPLTVTWRDPARLDIGQRNLQKLVEIGVDHIDFQINPEVERKFLLASFLSNGVPGIPKHMALYNIPVRLAVKLDIPLIVWGENAGIEYGDLEDSGGGFEVDYEWLTRHGVTQGTTAEDWISEELTRAELTAYFGPGREEMNDKKVRAVYLGAYFPWDPVRSYEIASRHGFEAPTHGPGYYSFDDVDSGFISIHHYIKWYKFGYTRLFDNLSHEIRQGRISRSDALEVIRERGPETPNQDIDAFCRFLGISRRRFFDVLEGFRNRDIWLQKEGKWMIDGYIIPDWDGWKAVGHESSSIIP